MGLPPHFAFAHGTALRFRRVPVRSSRTRMPLTRQTAHNMRFKNATSARPTAGLSESKSPQACGLSCSSCFWAYVGNIEDDDEQSVVWWDEYPHMSWREATLDAKYRLCLYWSAETMTQLGYSDILPITNSERMYTICVCYIGAALYAYIIANVSNLLAVTDPGTRRRNEEMEAMTEYIHERNFPKQLAFRMRRHYKDFLSQKATLNERRILDRLTPELRKEATDFLVSAVVKDHPAFRALSSHGMTLLHLVLRHMSIPKGTSPLASL